MAQARQTGSYPTDWPELARRVRLEAGNRCVRCRWPDDPDAGRMLTVHHFDGNRSNNARWNLMALCQRCHLSVQARVDPANPILFDPRPWAMPYIAGLYESGGCTPSPHYELSRWIRVYETTMKVAWPAWAPRPCPNGCGRSGQHFVPPSLGDSTGANARVSAVWHGGHHGTPQNHR